MVFFSIFSKSKNKEEYDLPWGGLPSIYEHIQSNLDDLGKLKPEAMPLPDEERRYEGEQLRWVAGGMDGAFGHHGGAGGEEKAANDVFVLINAISKQGRLKDKVSLYQILLKDDLMNYVDPVVEKIAKNGLPVNPHLHEYARWLAFKSPDRGAVKFGIVLLGLIGDSGDLHGILTLGKHEEFTLFSAVALTNSLENPEVQLWELAKAVDGWGRIHIVERLGDTTNPDLQDWLLREGYKNAIMYEYLAYTCAIAGKLKDRLHSESVDRALLTSTGEIIEALINGGPAESIDDYEDGADVVNQYLHHINRLDTPSLSDFLVLHSIKNYITENNKDWKNLESLGWDKITRDSMNTQIDNVVLNPQWAAIVEEEKNTNDPDLFWRVDRAAGILGIDLWDVHWERLTKDIENSGLWFNIMKSVNSERIDQVIALAEKSLPLDQIATGPEDSLGIGKEYKIHSCLDFILQDLRGYPGKGFALIETGIKSPVVRNRNMAIKALETWEVEIWPPETVELLREASNNEPNEDTRRSLEELIAKGP